MGISAGAKGGPKSDINVTPLVDVVLVLLIIFLVTMPVLMQHITIEVPRKLDKATEISVTTSITVTGNADGSVTLNDGSTDRQIQRVDLAKELRELILKQKADKTVFVDFADKIAWGEAVSIMDTIKGVRDTSAAEAEGETKIAIKTRDKTTAAPVP